MAIESRTKISVVIITKNEAKQIAQCILACQHFSDDIVVIDSESTDQTVSIAKKHGATVFIKPWEGYGIQKNYGNQQAKYDWIFSIDADEVPDSQLIDFLKHTELNTQCIYLMKLDDHFGSRKIKFSELRPKWKKRLFNKQSVKWNTREVHELLIIPDKTKFEKIKGRILHYSYESIEDFNLKVMKYATLGADQMIKENKHLSFIKKTFNPFFRFFRSYFLYAGFLEGKLGFQVSQILGQGLKHKYKVFQTLKSRSNE